MFNKKSLATLQRQKPNWKHLPTKAIRVPEIFCDRLLAIARDFDNGENKDTDKPITLEQLTLKELIKLQKQIPELISIKQEESCNRSLEQAILYLNSVCDGANAEDGHGFNKYDANFGRYLAQAIAKKQLIKSHAEAGLKMVRKYRRQLEAVDITLPEWEEIAAQYSAKIERTEDLAERRVEVISGKIAVFAPYDPTREFQSLAKSINHYQFNGSDKGWYYPLSQAETVAEAFPESEYDWQPEFLGEVALVQVRKQEAEEKAIAQSEKKAAQIIELIAAADLDAPLSNGWQLRDYQKEGVKWLLSHHKQGLYHGGILADDMGLGKTIVALVAAKAMQKQYNCAIFVICPVSLKDNWLKEAQLAEVEIEVYSNAYQKIPAPLSSKPYLVIADEAHCFQDEKSKRSKNFQTLIEDANCLGNWLLSGTPIKNGRPINLLPLLKAIAHPIIADKWEYMKRYCNAKQTRYGWDFTGAAHLDELSKKIEDGLLRRTKKQCLKELPPKTRLFLNVGLEPKEQKAYQAKIKELIADYHARVQKGEVDAQAEALVTLNYLRKVGSEFKTAAAIAWAEELLSQGQQVVIFTEYRESAEKLHQELGGELLTGETKNSDRQGLVERFQSGESKVFIGTIKAGGVGITLTAASNLLLVDRAFTPGDCEQAEDRIYRLGQQNAAFMTWLQLGHIDQTIDQLLATKQERIDLVLKGKRKTLRGLKSVKDLAKELLEFHSKP